MKAFLKSNIKGILRIKAAVAVMLGIMIIIDIILVMLEKRAYPTFSWVVRDHRPTLLWLTFLFGGLVSKVFYNRSIAYKEKEFTGFLGFMSVVSMLFVLGHRIPSVGFWDELVTLACGGAVAYRIWPQYVPAPHRTIEEESLEALEKKFRGEEQEE
ncbi:MAG TPA: hypothetical protein VD927_06260 [Chryseosolibacter sp.]|nr:hypothetical protein [Chryseosolibacter sp.]